MDKTSEPPPTKAATHDYTVENMQKLVEEMLNDPNLGCRSRVVWPVGGDGRSPGYQPPDANAAPDKKCYDFGYIISSI